jgi:glycosyltransferase involved in cell wall biosynthesis
MNSLSSLDYGQLLDACDVGLLFLDYRFTIPNFPSRLLDYMNHNLPILAATDKNTDVGEVITEGGFGWWCISNDVDRYNMILSDIIVNHLPIKDMGISGKKYLEKHYTTKVAYEQIIKAVNSFNNKQ